MSGFFVPAGPARASLSTKGDVIMDLLLTPGEIETLTGRKRTKEQCASLNAMGVRWKINASGALIVGRRHVEQVLCGENTSQVPDTKRPNFEALHA
ncbi:DUF4224 domain-containing protein [Vreelandella stevensii]|uniref:DUF4224 domain-containing protein n=1 Tax=Vreelandella stevensii TaxID=502821 RepID=UPI00403A83A3